VFGILICSGGFAAAVTTPLDVAKTRIMLAKVRVGNTSRHADGGGSFRVSRWSLQNEIQSILIMTSVLVTEDRIRCEQALCAELMKLCSVL